MMEKTKVLLASRDENLREKMSQVLRGAGYDVTEVVTIRGSLEGAGKDRPDLVLLDMNLSDFKEMGELIRARDAWERTFNAVPDLIMILDREHRIVQVNRAVADKLGCEPEELVGQTCYDKIHGTRTPPPDCPHVSLLKDGLGHWGEVYEGRLGGDFLVTVTPLHEADGRLIGSVHVARDITERKQAERALRRAHDELEKRVEERTGELAQAVRDLRKQIDERSRAERQLRESEKHLRFLSSQLMTIQEKERKRVAQEIHDGLGQMLTAIKYKVENILQPRGKIRERKESLESVIPLVQGSIEEARRIQMDLRPSILDDLGILATIKWFCREYQKVYSTIRITTRLEVEEADVADALKTVIYRVVQEGLNNVAKHSGASRVRLTLRKTNGQVELVITDNGTGFSPAEALSVESSKRGFGLSGMRERTELSGGHVSVKSWTGVGARRRASGPAGEVGCRPIFISPTFLC